jgi:hypothetical protein
MRRWTDHILRINCLLQHVIEGKTEVMGRRGRKCKQLLNDLKENRRYWKFKEEAPDCTLNRLWPYHGIDYVKLRFK